MEHFVTEKYHVKNLDCANCAAKIESGLKKLDGIDDATLDFASLTLHVRATDPSRVPEAVRQIEPDVELVPKDGRKKPADPEGSLTGFSFAKELSVLILAVLLFLPVLFFSWEF